MLSLILIRHAETDPSLDGRYCGSSDEPLNAHGHATAAALARELAKFSWDAIATSPLRRAVETAAPLAERVGLALTTEPRLSELDYGAWELLRPEQIAARDPELFARWRRDPVGSAPPGGEGAGAVRERALAAIEGIARAWPSGRVAVFSHKSTLRILLSELLGVDVALYRVRFDFEPASVAELELGPAGPRLRALGPVAALR